LCWPNGEAGAIRTGAQSVEKDDDAPAAGQDAISDAIDLRTVEEARPEKRELIGCEVNAIGVRPKVRIIAQAESEIATVIRRSLCTVVLHGQLVDRPSARRVARVTHRDVQMVSASECWVRQANTVERQCHMHETPDGLIVQTGRVGDGRTALAGIRAGAHDGRGIAVERVEVNCLTTVQERISGGVVDL
jgi:hypothetical protein